MDWSGCELIEIVPGKVSGAPILKGTRVQADAVLENYESGESVDEISFNFDLKSEDVRLVLAYASSHQLTKPALGRFLFGHEVTRSAEVGWQELKNGDLIKAAEDDAFDLLITCDRNLEYQQKVEGRKIAIVALSTNNWRLIRDRTAEITQVVDSVKLGTYQAVDCGGFRRARRQRDM